MNWEAIGVIGGLIFNVAMFIIVVSNRSEKRVVSISPDATTHAEFIRLEDQNREEHNQLFRRIATVERENREDMDRKLTEMQKASEDGREKIHQRINDVLQAVSELRGEVNARSGG